MNADVVLGEKINRVVASCESKEQMLCAARFVDLAGKRRLITSFTAMYWFGVIAGISHVHGWGHNHE